MIQALIDDRLDHKRVRSILYALRIAQANLKNVDLNVTDSDALEPELEHEAA